MAIALNLCKRQAPAFFNKSKGWSHRHKARKISNSSQRSSGSTSSDQSQVNTTSEIEAVCPICLDTFSNIRTASCNHNFCIVCYDEWFNQDQTCPVCRTINLTSPSRPKAAPQKPRPSSPLNAMYNQALIDNYRIQRGNYSANTKARAKQLVAEMHELERVPTHFVDENLRRRSSSLDEDEARLLELQQAISDLLMGGRR